VEKETHTLRTWNNLRKLTNEENENMENENTHCRNWKMARKRR
jgi:hypothetical protein